jgi:hypothetical protein
MIDKLMTMLKYRLEKNTPSPIHLIWGPIAIIAVIAAGFVAHYFHGLPACPFKVLTGYPCLTCGGTRCLAEMAHLSLWESFKYNPFVWLTVIGMIAFSLIAAFGILFKRRFSITLTESEKKVIRIAIIALMAINWIYLIFYLK